MSYPTESFSCARATSRVESLFRGLDERNHATRSGRAERALEGFSLTELLVVIAIVAILAALLMTALPATLAASQRSGCLSNLRQIGVGCAAYSADHSLAPVPPNFWNTLSTQGYILQTSSVWICPADKRTNKTIAGVGPMSYAYNAQKLGLAPTYWNTASLSSLLAVPSPAKTVYFSDAKVYFMNKTKANQNADFRHLGDINILFFDGHVSSTRYEDTNEFYDNL